MLPKVVLIMEAMTKKQQELVTSNLALMRWFVGLRVKGNQIPRYLEDDFISNAALSFCVSAIKYDEDLGYKFSTYACGGFKMGWKTLNGIVKDKYEKENFCSIEMIESIIDRLLENAPRTRHFDREIFCRVINKANLSWREMRVLEDYYFGNLSMAAIGKSFAITRERIRQIKRKLLAKLKRSAKVNRLTFEDFYVRE